MKRFQSIQIMRGIAASMVVLYHFGYSNGNFLSAFPSFGSLFKYGDLGVWMFFVISGFVTPYAMYSSSYRIDDGAWPFLLRRIVRLEPAYIVSLFLAFALAYAAVRTPGYSGPPEPSLKDFMLQFVYLAPWFGVPWLDDVAWTLAIEFQFYLFMLLAALAAVKAGLAQGVLLCGNRRDFVCLWRQACAVSLSSMFCIGIRCFSVPYRANSACGFAPPRRFICSGHSVRDHHPNCGRGGNFRAFDSRADRPAGSRPVVPRNDLIFSLPHSYADR